MKHFFIYKVFVTLLGALFLVGCGDSKTVLLSGIVEVQQVHLSFEEAGEIEAIDVEVNDKVAKTQRIASLDSTQLRLEIEALALELQEAKMNLKNLQTMPRIEELKAAEAFVDAKEAAFVYAKEELKRAEQMRAKNIQSAQTYEAKLSAYEISKAELQAAKNQAQLVASGTKEEVVLAQKIKIQALEKKLQAMQERLLKRSLYAPIEGVVLTRNFEAREFIKAGQPIVSVADFDDCWIKLYLPEPMLADISIAQELRVQIDAKEASSFMGRVEEIAQEASFAPRMNLRKEQRSDLYYAIKIKVQNRDHRLKPGMAADVYFGD